MTHNRILTTHIGSLPRPDDLIDLLERKHGNEAYDSAEFEATLQRAVNDIVKRQVDLGIDVVNDGEMGKVSYANYVTDRLTGFGGELKRGHTAQDLADYRDFAKRQVKIGAVVATATGYTCLGPITTGDDSELQRDLRNFNQALAQASPTQTFMPAASPGVVSVFQDNVYYATEDEYVEAVAEAMRPEYEAIVAAGHILQLDCPDLAMNRHLGYAKKSKEAFLRSAAQHVEALNYATRNIDPDKMRLHICWGNYDGPHHHDIPLEDIVDLVLKVRPNTILMEAANPRHAHEYEVFEKVALPAEKILAPGVIDTCNNYIEHPRLVAQRIKRYADIVGPERVMAGTDCGFATFARYPTCDPVIAWAKLEALVAGAQLATTQLFT